ncbi:MAG TPA: isoleucine--tRNA ligase [Solirubrobacterales bacterium]|jgi:isoleucyl-tRNA synthetase|nr:isoleucine--tRNA ligase [Solirubrobacterales bacterium]
MAGFRPVDPKQSFPRLEEAVLERWRERGVFARSIEQRADAPLWSFYEGPPTANGRPGSHHVLSRVFKDIYPRYRTMTGHRVPRKAGWDCHGLPVELEVEKELGIASKAEIEEYGIAEFNRRCRESVFRYVEDWDRLTERIGFWIDLDDPYVTMENDYIESVWWALRRIWDDGRLYEAYKVVPYCPRDGTALSSHEVALGYHEVEDPSVYVKLPVTGLVPSDEIPESPLQVGDQLLVWTTTPWTLISNAAVAAGPEIEYVRARGGEQGAGPEEVLVLARDRVEEVLGEGAELLSHFPGEALAGTRYEPPFTYITDYGPRGHSVRLADFVSTDEGTGLVHTAIAFGEDDFRLGQEYGITLQNPVRLDGTFDERISDFAGRKVKEADPDIVKALEARGRVLRAEPYLHSYPHCWRCDTALLYYAKANWYVATTEVKDRLLAENERIGWHPEHIKHGRFGKWLENNVDWALSRDRYWGTPLPVWRCGEEGCEEAFCAGSVEDLRSRGAEVPEDLHRPYIDDVVLACSREGCGGEMRRVDAVIDAWFDSGAMPFAQFHFPFENEGEFDERFPADYVCEAIDQTRGWFYTLLAESTLLFDQTSYLNCVCLGLILDPEGQKMSKSRGNVVDPWDVIDRHGADAFRWYYFTAQQPWAGYRFSVATVGEAVRQFLLTLWNTYSFWVLYANTEGLEPAGLADTAVPGRASRAGRGDVSEAPEETAGDELDRWVLSRLQGTVATVRERMDDFDCTSAGHAIDAFVEELSNWYVRLSRRRFWEGDAAAFATLRHCLLETAKLLAPFTPFLADEIYANLAGGAAQEFGDAPDSVHLCDFPEPAETLVDRELEAGMGAARRTVELGRAARAHSKIKVRQPLRKAVVVATAEERPAIERHAAIVSSELNVKEIEFVAEESDLVSYRVRPNYRVLGPRFGKHMGQAAAAIEALEADVVARQFESGGEVGITVDGRDHSLSEDDVQLVMEPLDGYQVEAEAGHAVALALELDDELRGEGWAREIVHAVQNARKSAGLEVSDRIELALGGDAELLDAARANEPYISGETLATAVSYGPDGAGETSITTTIIEGRELTITVTRV